MAVKIGQRLGKFLQRDLIKHGEGKLTYVQFFGFMLIALGVIYFASFLLPTGIIKVFWFLELDEHPEPDEVATGFFTTMLGIAFAFPAMLRGQTKDMSTMRIIVFMFANVICMLLLKIGWGKNSLTEIGLDGYWMGIIAFLFGAKATQAYFENATSFLSNKPSSTSEKNQNESTLSNIAIAQIAKVQNEEMLRQRFPSIEFISDTIKDNKSCLTLYLKDKEASGIPSFVDARINETTILKVQTEIITNIGQGKPHIAQLTNDIADNTTPQFLGSLCCMVQSTLNSSIQGVLTSGHIFTNGRFINFDGFVGSDQANDTLSNGSSVGELYFQQMIPNQDLAIVKLKDGTGLPTDVMKFPGGFYNVTPSDLNASEKNVVILSRGNNQRDAYIVDLNVSMRLFYQGSQKIMRNIILIGSDTDKNKSVAVSIGGDSGSCVYHKESQKIVGMLLGGNDKFSFVLPFEQTLISNNFKIL